MGEGMTKQVSGVSADVSEPRLTDTSFTLQ